MKIIHLLLLFTWICPAYLFGQVRTDNYRIHITEHPFVLVNDLESNWASLKDDSSLFFNNSVCLLVQLNDIPTVEQKQLLYDQGVELISYVPNFAWLATVRKSLTASDLVSLNVRNVSKIKSEWKLPEEIRTGAIPDYAGTNAKTTVRILFLNNTTSADWIPSIASNGVQIVLDEKDRNSLLVEGSLDQLKALAELPLVQYIELLESAPENEGILDESERIISTYISDNPGKNYYFNGDGVKIAVEEGGNIDSLENPNFRSRLDRVNESGVAISGHKTGVALRMGGAGNINPKERGTAFGATVYSGGFNFAAAAADEITIINRSVGWGCSNTTETYSSASENYDNLIRTNPTFMISHSAGNVGSTDCYAGSAGWGNITGLPKMAKNIFAVGASGSDGTLTGFSSRGPAKDGRILPSIVAPGGGGTSHASPNLSGVYGQLNQAYRFHNGGTIPNSGLLKAIILNTADDMLNPGPDFKTGYGHVNARKAYEVVRQNQFLSAVAIQGSSNAHTIAVPSNVKEVKVLVYWVDWEATPGIVTRALVNDLDIVLQDPNAVNYYPWVLNPAFNAATLDDPAVRAIDTLNNAEQVTISNPIAGNYVLTVTGSLVPQGPQTYFVTYEFVVDDIVVTHPHGGERFVPNETERIRWDACDSTLAFDLSYSLDNGNAWNSIASGVSASSRYFDWLVPAAVTDQALIRILRGQTVGTSDTTFHILAQPTQLELLWSCADSSLFVWDDFPNADGYIVYRIVGDYMDSVAFTVSNTIILNGLSLTEMEYVSIAAVQNGVVGRRIVAIERPPSNLNCVQNNVGTLEVLAPGTDFLPSCMSGPNSSQTIRIRNWGVNTIDSIPVAYRLNNGTIYLDTVFASVASGANYDLDLSPSLNLLLGTNLLEFWTAHALDSELSNDTISKVVKVYSSTSSNPNLTENFDSFTNCSTAWDCELVSCPLQNGWYNLPNGQGDGIDWRTLSGATATASTGPTSDHTSGSGRYLYLETSGPCIYQTARLHSPCFDLTGINFAELSFWYHAFGSSIGSLHVDVIADGAFYEDIASPVTGNQGNQWLQQVVDLSAFSGQQVVVVIRGITGGSFYGDLAIDDINIVTGPTAAFSTAQTQLCSGESIAFSNASANADSYSWSFSPNTISYVGGTNSNSSAPQVIFNAAGSYTVQLIANNAFASDTNVFVNYVTVWSGTPSIVSPTNYCANDSVIVTTNNSGASVSYLLNGIVQSTTNDSSFYYANAANGDTLSLLYSINGNCTLYSDSLVLTITNVNASIVQNGLQLESVNAATQYQWIDCGNNNTAILGANAQQFTPVNDGEYAVVLTENSCSDTSNCLVFSTIGLSENQQESVVLYPNPTSGEIGVQLGKHANVATVEVYDAIGKRIFTYAYSDVNELHFTLEGSPGMYTILLTTDAESSKMIPVVKL